MRGRRNIGIWHITPCLHALESRGETRSGASPLLWVPIYGRLGCHPACYGQHVLVSLLALNPEPLDSVSALIPPEPLGPAHFATVLLAYSSFVLHFRYIGKKQKHAKFNLVLNLEPPGPLSAHLPLSLACLHLSVYVLDT